MMCDLPTIFHYTPRQRQIEVSMDDYLRDTTAMEIMLLNVFQNDDQLGDGAHIADTFFESLKFSSTTPRFGPGS